MKHSIKIGRVEIPFDDYVTQGTALLGIRGAGKTYTAKGIAEQLLDAKVPIVVFDAIGVWRYLKIGSTDGHGYKVVVAGGHQPDLPLTPQSSGQLIRAAIRENIPLIIDLYDTRLSKADWRKIVQESFRILLYENTGLRHIFLEEAAEYVPQKITEGNGSVFAEVEKLVRMGGNKSLGITMINQRSQELNKSVLELCDNLVMMRQKGFNAIAYAEKWAERLSPDEAKEIGRTLPKMQAGECWVFTDAYDAPIFTRSDKIKSFHPDRKHPEHPKNSVTADPTEFVEKMATELTVVIEEAKANDPAELKRTIVSLNRQVAQLEQKAPEVKQSEPEKIHVITPDQEHKIAYALKAVEGARDSVMNQFTGIRDDLATLLRDVNSIASNTTSTALRRAKLPPANRIYRTAPVAPRPAPPAGDIKITSTQQRILDAIAWFESIGTQSPSTLQVGAIALIDATGGHFSNTVGPLSSAGLVTRGAGVISLTDEGRKYAALPDNLTTMDEYHDMLRQRVRRCNSAGGKTVEILDAIIAHGGGEATCQAIGDIVSIDHTGGHFSNMIGPLGTLGLIERRNGVVYPTEILFPSALK